MTYRPESLHSAPRLSFPLVSLQQALESALRLYAAQQNTRPLDEGTFRRLLGHDRQSNQLVRLAMAMSLYGLMERRKNTYALSEGAVRLFASADQGEFRTLVYQASTRPQGVRELANTSGARLDSRELDDDLRGRNIAEPDRALILKVLRENGEFVHQEQQLGELFGRIQVIRAQQVTPRLLGRIQGGARWMNTQAGRTANLALVVVLFVGSLTYVAFGALSPEPPSPERPTALSANHSSAPTAASTGAARTGTPRVAQPAVNGPAVNRGAPPLATADAPLQQRQAAASAVARTQLRGPAPSASPAPVRPRAIPSRVTRSAAAQSPAKQSPAQQSSATRSAAARASETRASETQSSATQSPVTINEPLVTGSSVALDQPLVTLARGRELAQMLFTQRLNGLWGAFSPSVRREWGDYPAFAAYREGGLKTFGAETRVVAEDVRRSGGVSYYTRTAVFERGPRHNWTLILGLDPGGTVVAFNIVAADVLPGLTALAPR